MKPHKIAIIKLQSWFRMLIIKKRTKHLWFELNARKLVLRYMLNNVIKIKMVPQIIT